MIYKNMEIHNVAEIMETEKGLVWKRFPEKVCEKLEHDAEKRLCTDSTGVEIRFVIKGESAVLRMASTDPPDKHLLSTFHVFRGGIQGGWEDHEINRYVGGEVSDFIIKKSNNMDILNRMTKEAGYDWSPEVVRVVFDRGHYRIVDLLGDVEPPSKEQTPKKTILAYGSSITHGSNAYTQSTAWTSVIAHHLNMDLRNLGMAGSCAMEPEVINYIAEEGEKGLWDIAVLELGVNVLDWDEQKITARVTNVLEQVAKRNLNKLVILISPFYCGDDFKGYGKAEKWRHIMEAIVAEKQMTNVTLVNGLELLDNMSFISADEVHPNIYGVKQVADRLLERIKKL